MAPGRAFAGDNEQCLGDLVSDRSQDAQQEVDILFKGHAADIQQYRSLRGDLVAGAETTTVALAKPFKLDAQPTCWKELSTLSDCWLASA